MPIDTRWDELTDADWENFARVWLEEARDFGDPARDDADEKSVAQSVVMLTFARPEHQWRFVLNAVALAESDEALGHIAAGPLEALLGRHGEAFVAKIEERADIDPKFARALTGVWKNQMSDSVWARVQALQARLHH